jgi:hypothetical protein
MLRFYAEAESVFSMWKFRRLLLSDGHAVVPALGTSTHC